MRLNQPDWSASSHTLAVKGEVRDESLVIYLILNAYWEPLEFELPPVDPACGGCWRRWIDTALDSPYDIVEWQTAPAVPGQSYCAEARSVVVLVADTSEQKTADQHDP